MTKPLHVTDEEFDNIVLNSPRPVVVDFWAPWCAPCRMVGPILDRIAGEYGDRLLVAKVNVDENPGVSARFGVRGIPTLLFVSEGKVVFEQVGAVPYGALKNLVREHLGVEPAEAA